MILIADSGATKTDWCVIWRGGMETRFRTDGINAAVMSEENVRSVLKEALDRMVEEIMAVWGYVPGDVVEQVHFYGAGLVAEEVVGRLSCFLKRMFANAEIGVGTDLMAAARALWGDRPGVAAILGTGSNSCLYDGKEIVANVRPGGFILGDEGGGAALGRLLLSDFVKGLLPEELADGLYDKGLDYQTVVKNVYNSANPASYLASFAPFVFDNIGHPYMRRIVEDNFGAFVRRSLKRYAGTEPLEVGVVGSVGYIGKDILADVARREKIVIAKCLKAPMDGLAEYYRPLSVYRSQG